MTGPSLIVAMTRRGVIGRAGGLPWKLSADLQRFKSLTMGHHLIMGRKTFASLGRVLPGRTSIVLSRQRDFRPPAGVLAAGSLDEALALANADSEPFVIGGAEVFRAALPRARRLYVTWVEAEVAGDTYFPEWNPADWIPHPPVLLAGDHRNEHPTAFVHYERSSEPLGERRGSPATAKHPT